jgi:hypothetical protein
MRPRHIPSFLLLLLFVNAPALAQDRILETEGPPPPDGRTDNCSTWHELYPVFGSRAHQNDWEDNGDGILSACDYLFLDEERFHVDWVGPTYWLSCQVILEPITDDLGNPECLEWIEVWPNYGPIWHVEVWTDNGDGELGICDFIWIMDPTGMVIECHIDEVGLNIHVTAEGTATEEDTWSKVKNLWGPFPF